MKSTRGTTMNRPRARAIAVPQKDMRIPLLWAAISGLALLAAFAMAPRADAQVFNSQPYTAAPDPAVEQLRVRVEQLEADLRKAIDRAEQLGAQLSDARRVAEQ